MEIKTLYSSDRYIVVDKPCGLLSDNNLVLGYLPCHRLDRETSGCIVLAKDQETKDLIQIEFKSRKVRKTYKTLVYGDIRKTVAQVFGSKSDEFTINAPVSRNPVAKVKFAIVKDGKDSVTDFIINDVVTDSNNEKFSLITCMPKTGRTHQIRVHLSSIGHPVVGDQMYAGEKRSIEAREEMNRMYLHASAIEFIDPYTNELISVSCPLPKLLSDFLVKED